MKAFRLSALLLAVLLLAGCAPKTYTSTFFAMDTVMELTAYGSGGDEALADAQALVEELDRLLSVTGEDSEIRAANRGETVLLSDSTADLLSLALGLCADTRGALDVTIYPVVRAWGFTTGQYQVPDSGTLSALLDSVDYTQVVVESGALTLPGGVELDLGSVAKGYTGDRIMSIFQEAGLTSAKITLGGNVQVLGNKPDGSPWRVGIRDPGSDGYAFVVEVTDRAVVTSGGYERYFEQDGVRYWHIIDPATGCPARSGLVSVTIISQSGVLADALSTALFVMGAEQAADYWRARDDFDFILIGEDGSVTITEGIEDSFSFSGDWENHSLEVIRR